MPRPTPHRLLLFALALCGATVTAVCLSSGVVFAHNTLVSSDPADGASLSTAPTQIVWAFDKTVPLDTMTATLIDSSGARSELAGSVHGAAGDTEVVTPLPPLQPGAVSVRWRLVGPDGHPLTGRVDFVVAQAVTATASAATTTPVAAVEAPSTTPPALDESVLDEAAENEAVVDGFSTPSSVRWVLRYASYLAVMAVVGILLTSAYVWAGAGSHPLLRQILSGSLAATAVLGMVQLLVVASDISGDAPWASFGSIDAATSTDAGMALAIRIVLVIVMWTLLFQYRLVHRDVYWTAVSLPGLGLLATWAYAGHSRSMRMPDLGVLTDVVHHAAAAAWIAGLAIVGWIVIPTSAPDVLIRTVRRFSRLAATSVAVLVVTGLIQTVRLIGNPTNLLDADHGRYLAAKLVVLAVMLGIANVNRRRVDGRLDNTTALDGHLGALRRAVVAEFVIGLAIVGLTAAMVVSPPTTSESANPAPTVPTSSIYYTM